MSTNKPLPTPTEISAPYWNGLKEGRLTLPHCKSCGHWIFFPRRHCDKCWSQDLEWKEVKGTGTLYTYTLTRVPTLPDFAD
ncbi:MAG: Zn-ribbon domain-containing OB-fold protein [Thauera sp.]